MEKKVIVICSVAGFLGLLSAALGFAAENKRIKASQIQFLTFTACKYPSTPALGLGLGAAFALMVAQIIINVYTGCFCCKKGPRKLSCNRTLNFICFIISWLTFVIAFVLFVKAAVYNGLHGKSYSRCYFVKPGFFAGAAVVSLVSVTFGIASVIYDNHSAGGSPPSQASIAM